jgi:acetolactate synthase-1/2/3 large subunit
MNAAELVARILKAEGVPFLACYPRTALIDACARSGIRPVICRQERVGVGIADGYTRSAAGDRIGVFAAQSGPGIENAYPGVAQAYADNIPLLIIPSGSSLERIYRRPAFDAVKSFESITKWAARAHSVEEIPSLMRRAFHLLRSGRGGPVLIEIPAPLWQMELTGAFDYAPVSPVRSAPDAADVCQAAELLLQAKSPVIWAGQGILRAAATRELVELAELLDAPVLTTNPGKSAFPENHPLSLGAAAVNAPPAMTKFIADADVVFAVGSSLTWSPFNPDIPRNKTVIQLSNAEDDLHKEVALRQALLGDAQLGLAALVSELKKNDELPRKAQRARQVLSEKTKFIDAWHGQLSSSEIPLNPYRIIRDIMRIVDVENTIITHDSGSPREHLLPFWESISPGNYVGWGKTTQLGHSLGLSMGSKLASPDKTCIAVMGDAAFCMTGLDMDTAIKNRIAVLIVVLNNGVMACEKDSLKNAAERYDAFDIGGNYADIAAALDCYSQRVTDPGDIESAITAALETLRSGRPALLEFITKQCYDFAGKSFAES